MPHKSASTNLSTPISRDYGVEVRNNRFPAPTFIQLITTLAWFSSATGGAQYFVISRKYICCSPGLAGAAAPPGSPPADAAFVAAAAFVAVGVFAPQADAGFLPPAPASEKTGEQITRRSDGKLGE